jgi:hypothetical protein
MCVLLKYSMVSLFNARYDSERECYSMYDDTLGARGVRVRCPSVPVPGGSDSRLLINKQ